MPEDKSLFETANRSYRAPKKKHLAFWGKEARPQEAKKAKLCINMNAFNECFRWAVTAGEMGRKMCLKVRKMAFVFGSNARKEP